MFPECEFPIIDGERGFVLMDMATGQEVPIHRRCLLLWVVPAAVDSIGEDPNDGPVG